MKEKIIPRAVDWFTGEALQYEELEDDIDEGDLGEDDDEEDEDGSEERDDEDESDDEVRPPFLCRGRWLLICPGRRFETKTRSC